MRMAKYFSLAAALFIWSFHCPQAWAVETTGIVEGVVEDATGAVVPDARVSLTNEATGEIRDVVTNELGRFTFPNVPVGTYTLSVEKEGFKRFLQVGIPVRVTEYLNLRVVLEVGEVATEVEVTAAVTKIETKSSTLGKVIENKAVVDLPLNGRNFLQLTTLVPGSVPAIGYSLPGNPTTPGGITLSPQVNGMRSESNYYLLDGADNNEPFLGSAAAVPSVESLQEFKMQSNLYSAEFGSGGGSIVNVVTKSGSNEFHGAVYEFLRNDALDARNFFAPEVSPLKRNQFGFSLGGPVVKTRTFFFVNYEGFRERAGQTRTASVPSVLERSGDFSQSAVRPIDPFTGLPFPGDTIPPARIHPISQNLLQFYPLPNAGTGLHTSTPMSPNDNDQVLVRIDHELRKDKDYLMVRYFFQDGTRTFHFVPSFLGPVDVPNFPAGDLFRFQNVAITNTHTFSPSAINETRFNYNRAGLGAAIAQYEIDAQALGFTFPVTAPFHNIPLIAISGLSSIGTSNFVGDTVKANNVFTFENTLSLARGRHLIKAGFRVGSTQVNATTKVGFNGSYLFAGIFTGNPLADFLLGQSLFFLQIGGDNTRYFRTREYSYFVQDSFSVTPYFTLNFGLRHEIFTPTFDRGRRMPAFRPGEQSIVRPTLPPGVLYPGDPGISRSTYKRDNTNFGPRIGIAWDPFKNGKTSIRAGYGIYYDPPITFITFQTFVAPGILPIVLAFVPNFADPFLGASPFQPGVTVFPVSPGTQVNYVAADLKTPYVQQYNFTIQHEVARDYVFEVGYVGTKASNLLGTVEVNPPVFIPGASTPANVNARRPYQPWGQVFEQRSGFSSNYNSLQMSMTKHWSRGFALLASYTWSKAIDTVSVPQQFQAVEGQPPNVIAANPRDLDAERAAASFDVRHRFVTSFNWQLPFFKNASGVAEAVLRGWQLNGILQLQSGLPFTVFDNSDPNFDGETSDRPNLIGSCHPSGFNRTLAEDFDTSAFVPVPAGSGFFGNAGRNVCRARSIETFDLSIFKTFNLSERVKLQFRTEFFNLFNHPNFAPPVSDINSPDFGRIVNTLPGNERQIQFALRLSF